MTQGRSRGAPSDRRRPDLRDRDDPAQDRYKLHRVNQWFPGPPPPPVPFVTAVRFAIYFVIGARVKGYDLMADAG
jgi:hypothetical protein